MSEKEDYLDKIERLLRQAVFDNFECDNCGSPLEPDAKRCGICGWRNSLVDGGYI